MQLVVTQPRYLPSGYVYWSLVQGQDAGGFGRLPSDDQYALVYVRGTSIADIKSTALEVYRGPATAKSLVATDGREGSEITLGVPDVSAIYHDGLWILGAGSGQRTLGQATMHWETNLSHSITVRGETELWGVRAPKAYVDQDELAKVADSLFDS